jgi:hypothetical protein
VLSAVDDKVPSVSVTQVLNAGTGVSLAAEATTVTVIFPAKLTFGDERDGAVTPSCVYNETVYVPTDVGAVQRAATVEAVASVPGIKAVRRFSE